MLTRLFVLVVVSICLVTSTDAQLFRRRSTCSSGVCFPSHNKFAVPVLADAGGDTIVINNSYPAPIAPQASTLYGYEYGASGYNLQQHFSVDPNRLMREAARLTEGAQSLHSQALTGFQTSADQLSKAALDNQRIALAAAMLDQMGVGDPLPATSSFQQTTQSFSGPQQSQALSGNTASLPVGTAICIEPDGNGGLTISVKQAGAGTQPQTGTLPDVSSNSGPQLFEANCLSCHGSQSEIPFVDVSNQLAISSQQRDSMVAKIQAATMPPKANAIGQAIPPMSEGDKAALVSWLDSLN